jgi:hypothetical protein
VLSFSRTAFSKAAAEKDSISVSHRSGAAVQHAKKELILAPRVHMLSKTIATEVDVYVTIPLDTRVQTLI